ncbi:hypothetical protein BZA77DRAFT_357062 [Pyronema omphalodes]|nr:hypothetical protein BZA77DRAFT_357062 [Pyronema omphalodes]
MPSSSSCNAAAESSVIATAADCSTTTNAFITGVSSSAIPNTTDISTTNTFNTADAPSRTNTFTTIIHPTAAAASPESPESLESLASPTSITPTIQSIHPTTTETIDMNYCMDLWLGQTREEDGVRWFRG